MPLSSSFAGSRFFTGWAFVSVIGLSGCSSLGGDFEVEAPEKKSLPILDRLAPEDGTIISALDTGIARTWEELDAKGRARFSEDDWEVAVDSVEGNAELLTYSSDGLRVGALLVRPASTEGRRLGAVIVNRDGLAGRGLDEDLILADLARYAQAGFVAASSAYRGNRLSQGVDELGGDDVNDVLALTALLQRLDYVDPGRIFMVGFGRGGLMTYRAIEEGAPVRAAAVISGIADVSQLESSMPEISRGFRDAGGWPGLAKVHEDSWSGAAKADHLDRRSPARRAETFETPLLVVHGRLDETVPVAQALGVAAKVSGGNTPLETVLYGYGDHDLIEQQADWRARVLEWIQRHDARSLLN
ncbi:MAG: prolyl oligopeptidase family serine peptidase [Planctomycetota bacterium]